MVRGRSRSAAQAGMTAGLAMIGLLLLNNVLVESREFIVGDAEGWTLLEAKNWAKGKKFHSGDTLVFNYELDSGHNVVELMHRSGYEKCQLYEFYGVYNSGQDRIVLRKGKNYFACGGDRQCALGMKMTVTAL